MDKLVCRKDFFQLLIFLLLYAFSKSESYKNNMPCAYSFHVWNPGNDIVQKVKDVKYQVDNMTGYIEREFLQMKSNMLEELRQCQNWTMNLERDITDLKFKSIKGRITERDTSNGLTNVERDILDLKKKVSHLKNNYQKMHRSMHITKPANLMSQRESDLLELLKNAVRDLKAEWVVIKRDVIELQIEHRDIKIGQNKHGNHSFHISQSIKSLAADIDTLDKVSQNITKTLNSQSKIEEEQLDLIKALEIREGEYLKTTESIQHRLNEMDEKVTNVNEEFGMLKDDNAYLKEIVLASLKKADDTLEEKYEIKRELKSILPKDCQDIMEMGYDVSGVYQIKPEGTSDLDNIYCEILNGTAYTVIQRRTDGLMSFNRQWIEYKFGFGNLYGSHWVGNEWIHLLTNQNQYTLRIDMWDWEGKKHFAEYAKFFIDSQDMDYRLTVGDYTGNAGDSLSFHDGMKFSTEDMDNDLNVRHCAAENKSGWWFNNCYLSNLNGVYHVGYYSHTQYSDGIVWYTLKEDEKYSLRKVEMKLRRNK